MVLPDRIELSTSPLPMECSTTELRQHARYVRIGPKRPRQAAGSCHKDPSGASTRRGREGPKMAKNGRESVFERSGYRLAASNRANSGPIGSISLKPAALDASVDESWRASATRRLRGGWTKPNMSGAKKAPRRRRQRAQDAGRSRQARGKNRPRRERFTTGAFKTGAA